MEGCSSERPAVVNLSNGIKASKQENNSPLITPADISNSGKLVENATSASDSKFLQSIFTTLEEAPLIRNKVTTEGGVTLVQVQKRPARGLVAMLGPSKWKQKNEMSSKVYDTEQDHGLASENNNSKVLGIAGQTEEISSLVGDQYGEVPVLCNSSDKKVIGKRMKLHDKARLVNQKLGHPEMQFTTAMHMNSNGLSIASMEGAEAHLPCVKLGKREIKSWCPIEWAILGKTFLAKSIIPQEPSYIWEDICTSLHWDPGGRPYERWIQCLLMALLESLHDAPCVDTTQGSGGCILTSAILRLIWDLGITVTDRLVIARGCFQEVSGDGTVQCSVLSRGCCRSPRIIWDPGIIPGFSWFG